METCPRRARHRTVRRLVRVSAREVGHQSPGKRSFPAGEDPSSAQVLESGTFYAVVHPTAGTATIYGLENGDRILRFTNFSTSNGPNVHVYRVDADDAKDSATVKSAASIDLGTIKGNIGDQNYALGTDLDLSKYRTVSIWCKRFAVNFGAAPLRADHAIAKLD
jgi:Electron transfer DM13